jgi:hypothetical protein
MGLRAILDLPMAGLDCFRRATSAPGTPGFREWHHFGVLAEGLDVLINFSLLDGAPGAPPDARVAVLVREGQWSGHLERYAPSDVQIRVGRLSARFGDCTLEFDAGAYRLTAKLDSGRIALDLVLHPLTTPFIARDIELASGDPLHWFVIPRLVASGSVSVGGKRRAIRDVMAYHDHNWGHWGSDCAWDWGFGLPDDPSDPWSLVFVRLSNRARSVTHMQALLLWDGVSQRRVFRNEELQFTRDGLMRRQRLFKLPPVMDLLSPGDLTDAPKKQTIDFMSEGDRGTMTIESDDVAQIIVPDDGDPGFLVINEVSASYILNGTIRGKHVTTSGRAVFEHVHV